MDAALPIEPPVDSPPRPRRPFRDSWIAKLIAIILLILSLLLAATVTVGDLIRERKIRQHEVTQEIAQSWGDSQTLLGPLLVIPYTREETSINNDYREVHRVQPALAVLLPDAFDLSVTLRPELRRRGLFSSVVYRALINGKGTLPVLDPARFPGALAGSFRIEEARVVLNLSDLRSLEQQSALRLGDQTLPWEPSSDAAPFIRGGGVMAAAVGKSPGIAQTVVPFSFTLDIAGSDRFNLIPIGKETRLKVDSSWPHPSFGGRFLPAERKVSPDGFTAQWRLTHFGRSFGQQIGVTGSSLNQPFESAAFGVGLLPPVTEYRMVERALKYAILVISVVFGVFILFELLNRLRLHIIQYALVGAALVIQFVLLLAFSEHIGFSAAYASSAGAVTVLIAHYARTTLASWRAAGIAGGALLGIYGIIFVLLRLEDHALLAGAIALFLGLAAFMHLTRRIDWGSGQSGV